MASAASRNTLGRLSSIVDDTGAWDLSYDAYGRESRVAYSPDAAVWDAGAAEIASVDLVTSYDRQNNPTSYGVEGLGGTIVVVHTRDALGVVLALQSNGDDGLGTISLASTLRYDGLGRLRKTSFGNGTEMAWTYDDVIQYLTGVSLSRAGSTTPHARLEYSSFDKNGNVGLESRFGFRDSVIDWKIHGYDWLDRLQSSAVTKGDGSQLLNETYTYSPRGNIDTAGGQTYSYKNNANTQAVTTITDPAGARELGYDRDGFLATDTGINDREFNFDASGCLRRLVEYDASGLTLTETESICGPDGRRLVRQTWDHTGPSIDASQVIYVGNIGELRPADDTFVMRLPIGSTTVIEEARSLVDGSRVTQESGYLFVDMRGSVLAKSTYFEPSSGSAVELVFFHGHDHCFATERLDHIIYQEVGLPNDTTRGVGHCIKGRVYDPANVIRNPGIVRVTVTPEHVTIDTVRSNASDPSHNGRTIHSVSIWDCNLNGRVDSKEIARRPALDADGNGRLDNCTQDLPGRGLVAQLIETKKPKRTITARWWQSYGGGVPGRRLEPAR